MTWMPGTAAHFHLRVHFGVIYGLMANPNHPAPKPETLFVSSGKNLKMLSGSGRCLICRDTEHPSAKISPEWLQTSAHPSWTSSKALASRHSKALSFHNYFISGNKTNPSYTTSSCVLLSLIFRGFFGVPRGNPALFVSHHYHSSHL